MTPSRARTFLVALGVAGGLSSGLLGVGGGVLIVPGLVLVTRMAQRRAHAASLAAIIPIGIIGAAVYAAREQVNYALAALLAAGSVFGASLGVRLLHRVPENALRVLFAGVAMAAAVRLLTG